MIDDRVMLRTSPGAGLVVRKPGAVLFLPAAGDDTGQLLTVFESAEDGRELQALAQLVVTNDFRMPPFACVSLGKDVTVRVFGDLTVTSDAPSLPRLSAHGLPTWVDHTLSPRPTAVTIEAGESAAGSITNLERGIAHAGGIGLSIGSVPAPDPVAAAGPSTTPGLELVFEDGNRLMVDGPVVIGRNPLAAATERAAMPWVIEDERISRAHVIVSLTDDGVTVEDCGSRNGTLHVLPGGAAPIPLSPGCPTPVEPGTTVYLGSSSFLVSEQR